MMNIRFSSTHREQACKAIECLSGSRSSKVTIQFLHDSDKSMPPKIIHGTIKECWKEIKNRNINGYGVFFTVNKTDLNGRRKDNVQRVRAVFTDDDTGKGKKPKLRPSVVIQSKRGLHSYWLVDDLALDSFSIWQKHIAKIHNTDPAVNDLPRVMRLPGTYHMKNLKSPFLVVLKKATNRKFSLKDFIFAWGNPKNKEVKPSNISSTKEISRKEIRNIHQYFIECLKNAYDGNRNDVWMKFCREALAQEVSEKDMIEFKTQFCSQTDFSPEEASIVYKWQKKYHEQKNFTSSLPKDVRQTAKNIITKFYSDPIQGQQTLLFHEATFWKWNLKKYDEISVETLEIDLLNHLDELGKTNISTHEAKQVCAHLKALSKTREGLNRNKFISDMSKSEDRYVTFESGILNISRLIRGEMAKQEYHSPDLFSTNCLPFKYDPEAACPIFHSILKRALPKKESRRVLLTSWMEYKHTVLIMAVFAVLDDNKLNPVEICYGKDFRNC
ncbi:hypothetical protein [Bdellovibrio bacteriovorus]|uniref:hypothetical protein n=1 Tax=Bdellovibrio TaxID=958 RepID=UPI0035A86F93